MSTLVQGVALSGHIIIVYISNRRNSSNKGRHLPELQTTCLCFSNGPACFDVLNAGNGGFLFLGRCSKMVTMPNFKKHEIFQIMFKNPAVSSQKGLFLSLKKQLLNPFRNIIGT